MTELAVVVPTRSRPQNVTLVLDAWRRTGAFGTADLVFVVDQDDARYKQYRQVLDSAPEPLVLEFKDWQPLVPKLNRAASALERMGKYSAVAFCGDDHLPATPGWAQRLVGEHLLNGAKIVYGRDGFQDEKLPTWWSMSSSVVKALGGMVPSEVQHLYCDNVVKTLGEKADALTYLPDVLIEHVHPFAGKGTVDDQYLRVNRNEQYERDGAAFRAWLEVGADGDATLVRNAGR